MSILLQLIVGLFCVSLYVACFLDLHVNRRIKFPPTTHYQPFTTNLSKMENAVQEHGYFDGYFYQVVSPKDVVPKAIVVGFHGYGDHSDSTMSVHAHQICKEVPCIFVLFDQKGFGRSDGLFGFIRDWKTHVQGCSEFVKQVVTTRYPGIPVYGLGHSMGGGVAINIAIIEPDLFAGLILLAPMAGLQESQKPSYYEIKALQFLAFFHPTSASLKIPSEGHNIFRDPKLGAETTAKNFLRYANKPRYGTVVSLLFAQNWLATHKHLLKVPFYLIQGTEDQITKPQSSQELFEAAESEDKQIEILDGYHHCVVGEGQKSTFCIDVYNKITKWLLERV